MAITPTPGATPFVEALSDLLRAIAGVVALLPYAGQPYPNATQANNSRSHARPSLMPPLADRTPSWTSR